MLNKFVCGGTHPGKPDYDPDYDSDIYRGSCYAFDKNNASVKMGCAYCPGHGFGGCPGPQVVTEKSTKEVIKFPAGEICQDPNEGLLNGFVIDPVKKILTYRLDSCCEAGVIPFAEDENFKAFLAKIEADLHDAWGRIWESNRELIKQVASSKEQVASSK